MSIITNAVAKKYFACESWHRARVASQLDEKENTNSDLLTAMPESVGIIVHSRRISL